MMIFYLYVYLYGTILYRMLYGYLYRCTRIYVSVVNDDFQS